MYNQTTVVHCKKHPYDVYIGRGSKWGNIYTHIHDKKTKAEYIVNTRSEAIEMYRRWIMLQPNLLTDLPELKGKRLGCYCVKNPISEIKNKKICHGEVLLELINEHCL